jgi:hypothetical protein
LRNGKSLRQQSGPGSKRALLQRRINSAHDLRLLAKQDASARNFILYRHRAPKFHLLPALFSSSTRRATRNSLKFPCQNFIFYRQLHLGVVLLRRKC